MCCGKTKKEVNFPMQLFSDLFSNVLNFTWQQLLMVGVGCLLVYLAI